MKKRNRLSDTAALVEGSAGGGRHESVSIRTRPIDNGWITSTSRESDGGYECCERFSKDRPVLADIGAGADKTGVGGESLRDAVRYLKE